MSLSLIIRRAAAYILDIFMLFPVLGGASFLVQRLLNITPTGSGVYLATVLSFSLPVWIYFTLAATSRRRGTIGQMLTRVQVEEIEGERLSIPKAFGRTAVKLIPWELIHFAGFALPEGSAVQAWGIILGNALTLVYFGVFVATSGSRSVHDYVIGSQVTPRVTQ